VRVLRRIFGTKREELAGGWRMLQNEKLHNLRMRWRGHVARIGEMRNAYSVLVENLEGIYRSEDLGADGKIILKWILGK
jgi:hypothetical protein